MRLAVSVCAFVLVGWSSAALALEPAQKCQASKLKIAGKYALCRLKAEAKGVKTGSPPDYSSCDEKFGLKWSQAETDAGAGVCPSEGDQSSVQAFITGQSDVVAAALAGGPLADCPGMCGNGTIDGVENCDQGNLNGETCVTQGFAGGTLACASGCAFDTTACWNARFADNADGTITDNETGLMWEKKTELDGSANFGGNAHDVDNYYQWAGTCSVNTSQYCQPTTAAATLCAANAESGTTGCDECTGGDGTCSATDTVWTWAVALNAASFGGHTDWRIPKRRELEGILDPAGTAPAIDVAFHGASCGGACTDITDPDCGCTWDYYWTASTFPRQPEEVWLVDCITYGYLFTANRAHHSDGYYVRAVRGGS